MCFQIEIKELVWPILAININSVSKTPNSNPKSKDTKFKMALESVYFNKYFLRLS